MVGEILLLLFDGGEGRTEVGRAEEQRLLLSWLVWQFLRQFDDELVAGGVGHRNVDINLFLLLFLRLIPCLLFLLKFFNFLL